MEKINGIRANKWQMACTTYRNVNYIKIRKILHQEDATVADIIFVYEPEGNVLLLMNW